MGAQSITLRFGRGRTGSGQGYVSPLFPVLTSPRTPRTGGTPHYQTFDESPRPLLSSQRREVATAAVRRVRVSGSKVGGKLRSLAPVDGPPPEGELFQPPSAPAFGKPPIGTTQGTPLQAGPTWACRERPRRDGSGSGPRSPGGKPRRG